MYLPGQYALFEKVSNPHSDIKMLFALFFIDQIVLNDLLLKYFDYFKSTYSFHSLTPIQKYTAGEKATKWPI